MNLGGIIRKHHRILFFAAWLIINLVQAATTELFDDEAYYWIYSQYPAWGYFDHPPMIAWLIKAGYAIFPNELGVRLFIVLMNTATIYFVWKLLEKKDDFLFYAIAASIAVTQIGGIIAVPDLPLLFFVSVYFLLYRRFLNNMNAANSLLLGISIALMLYSKYHGVLIVIATLVSNPKLLGRWQAWFATIVAIALFAPHLYWQYIHGFPSVQFHLFERNAVSYRPSFTLEYFWGQIALAGPIVGWLFMWASFKYKPASLTERAMKFSLVGIYLLFLISTLKGRVEANWTVPGFVGLIVLSHQWLLDKPRLSRVVKVLAPYTLLIVVAGRIFMALDLPVSSFISKDEFHENKRTAQLMKEKTKGLPLVVVDSYQKPSKHLFYAQATAFSLNSPWYRRNNFNYWPMEENLIGKPAYVVGYGAPFSDTIPSPHFKGKGGLKVDNYYSFSKVRIKDIKEELVNRQLIQFTCSIETPANYLPLFQQSPYDTAALYITLYDKRGDVSGYVPTSLKINQIKDSVFKTTVRCDYPFSPGEHSVRLGISTCVPGFPSLNSSSFKFTVQ